MQRRLCKDSIANSPSVVVEAFWTSAYQKYNNRIEDMETSIKLYEEKDTLTQEQISEILGPQRLKYLTHHLNILPYFPVVLELPNDVFGASSFETKEIMPNCSDLPINDWLPVGVSTSGDDNLPHFSSAIVLSRHIGVPCKRRPKIHLLLQTDTTWVY